MALKVLVADVPLGIAVGEVTITEAVSERDIRLIHTPPRAHPQMLIAASAAAERLMRE